MASVECLIAQILTAETNNLALKTYSYVMVNYQQMPGKIKRVRVIFTNKEGQSSISLSWEKVLEVEAAKETPIEVVLKLSKERAVGWEVGSVAKVV